ncbi:hypothetical protein KAI78_04840 [bacterium]|nr:hypothetical protein [bacterium]
MFRFEAIPTNNERCVPFVVRKRRERKKLTKDDMPFGLKLFFGLFIPQWVFGVHCASHAEYNSFSHCKCIYETVHY